MSLIQYRKPYSLLNELQSDLSQFFGNSFDREFNTELATKADWSPSVDIVEKKDQYIIHADVPGMKADDIEVTMENGILSLKGHREVVNQDEGDRFSRMERIYGSFHRRFSIPDAADSKRIDAKFENGVLTITIPKGEELKPRRIKIH